MKNKKLKVNNSGFVLLFAVVLSSILLAIALGVSNVALKEIVFGTSAIDSNRAFFAADTGAECALINDKIDSSIFDEDGGTPINCAGNPITLYGSSPEWYFSIPGSDSDKRGCAYVEVNKTEPTETGYIATSIVSKGYNVMSDGQCPPSPSNSKVVERELDVTYSNYDNSNDIDTDSFCGIDGKERPFRDFEPDTLSTIEYEASSHNGGYKFTVEKSGTITELAFRVPQFSSGQHAEVTLYDHSYDGNKEVGDVLESVEYNASDYQGGPDWVVADIPDIWVEAGDSFVVSVWATNISYYQSFTTGDRPTVCGNIILNDSRYSNSPDKMPSGPGSTTIMYGQADITFVPD